MKTRIILLRGVMPTGKNKVLMAPLRAALEEAGLDQVRTYIQSGNVLASSDLPQAELEALVHRVIAQSFGGDIRVLAREAPYFQRALTRNPFKDEDPAKLYFTLLAHKPADELVASFHALGHEPDQIRIVGDMAYVLCATRYSEVKANNNFIERKLKLPATTRNFNTLSKLIELAAA